jgi:hypothetical protein
MAHQISTYQWRGLVWLIATLCGCTTAWQTSLDIITIGKAVGLRAPYTNLNFYAAKPPLLFPHLLNSLEKRGAQILVADSQAGLIS